MSALDTESNLAIGARLLTLGGPQRVRGDVPYVLNAEAPGALAGAIMRSRSAHARLVRVDASAALALPGVLAVVTRDDLAEPAMRPYFGTQTKDQPVLAIDRVRYVGEPVAAVAAVDLETAEEAVALIEVEYEELEPILSSEQAAAPGALLLHDERVGNLAGTYTLVRGDTDEGFRLADGVVERVYTTPSVQHVSLEPHVVLARVETGGRLVVETSTQAPHAIRRELAEIFGLSMTEVRVIVPTLGGGFGGKAGMEIEPIAVLLARKARRPVKITLRRDEEFVTTARPVSHIRVRAGYTREGRILALEGELAFEEGAYTESASQVTRASARALAAAYNIPHLRIVANAYYVNTTPCGSFRAPGTAQGAWAIECHMDEIARAAGLDPLAVRLRNLVQSGQSYVDSGLLEGIRYPEMLRAAADAVGYGHPKATLASGERIGRGLAVVLKTSTTPSTSTATVKMNEDGSVDVLTSSIEMGQGMTTVMAQIAAEQVAVDPRRVRVSLVDTDVTPFDHGTSASRTTAVMGTAVTLATEQIAQQLRELAAEHLEVSADDVVLSDGRAAPRGAPHRSVDFAMLIKGLGNLLGQGTYTARAKPDPVTGLLGASEHYHQSVGAAEVAVDPETGRVRVLRFHQGVFAGRAVNPTLCELQIDGSGLFGLGQALFEEIRHDAGQVTNANLADYLIPSIRDVPGGMESAVWEEPEHGELHGIGEVAMPLAPPAIANAIADALDGARVADLPLTPERVLSAWREHLAR